MIVIAKTIGPKYNGSEVGCLTPGKEYKAIEISYQVNSVWVKKELTYNPEEPRFYIKVIDDNGKEHDIWNDYFLSTKEIRLRKLYNLGL